MKKWLAAGTTSQPSVTHLFACRRLSSVLPSTWGDPHGSLLPHARMAPGEAGQWAWCNSCAEMEVLPHLWTQEFYPATPHCKSCLFYYYFIYSQPCSPDFYDFHHAARFAKLYSWKWDLPQPLHRPPSVWAGCHGRTRPFEEEIHLEKIKARKQALLKPLHKMKNFTLTGKSEPLLLQHINITSKSEQNKGHLSQLRPTCNLWKAFNKCFYFKESLI